MLKITQITIDGKTDNIVTDNLNPCVGFALESDVPDTRLEKAVVSVGDWNCGTESQLYIPIDVELKPFTKYVVDITAVDNHGERCSASAEFETGRLGVPWQGKWITDLSYKFNRKKVSPVPMLFSKSVSLKKQIKCAKLYATALGVYDIDINGKKVGDRYFAPGFTSYKHNLQYQTYDVTNMLCEENTVTATVAGGWAVGAFTFKRYNRVCAKRQAFLCELRIEYEDGSKQVVCTDESWQVTCESAYKYADFYDGEIYDARISFDKLKWHNAGIVNPSVKPLIYADLGAPVKAHEVFEPVSVTLASNGETIYDFGQNKAGVVCFSATANEGRVITVKHAEILENDGRLCTRFLRSAKAQIVYTCVQGEQSYSPKFTYMGFRYVSVKGIEPENIKIKAIALYSDMERVGSFECSDKRINRFNENAVWSAKSNFVDIPTDCPQRDERMGWTGDIAVFSPVACYNFNMSAFFKKWMRDVRAEQGRGGGIPTTVPANGFKYPDTIPLMAVDTWGDACVLVPWNEYKARGDVRVLKENYKTMKAYVDACAFWSNFLSVGNDRYIWGGLKNFHFGDWVAPDTDYNGWRRRFPWTGTASLANTSATLAKIASVLGNVDDEAKYTKLNKRVSEAYVRKFTDGNGKLKKEFQTAYVLPLAYGMFQEDTRQKAVNNLVNLVKENNYCVGTGFPATSHILFALADNGRADDAYKMLLNTKCPSWLYEVEAGATTIWERWDAIGKNGIEHIPSEDMVSFNHYASGAAADFLYRRVAGLEATEAGYRSFKLQPVLGGGLTYAKASIRSPYGLISSEWKNVDGIFSISFTVPVGTTCTLVTPSGKCETYVSGTYEYTEKTTYGAE